MRRGRAFTDQQKIELMADLLACWRQRPHERLGQFLSNVCGFKFPNRDIFFVEDQDLIDAAFERIASKR